MQTLAILLVILCPIFSLAGVLVGAWLNDRQHKHLPPLPNVAGAIKSIIAVVRRKTPETPQRIHRPRMRA